MQVVQVNTVGLQATRAFVTLTQKCFRATVLCLKTAFPVNPSLAGEDQVTTTVPQRSGDQSFDLALNTLAECGVKKISSRVGGGFPCGQAVGIRDIDAGDLGNRPAAQGNGGDLDSRPGESSSGSSRRISLRS